tara:strand:- start:96 stop:215 length:120 start_codon:yes stop_codon:yes gene_type:complete
MMPSNYPATTKLLPWDLTAKSISRKTISALLFWELVPMT